MSLVTVKTPQGEFSYDPNDPAAAIEARDILLASGFDPPAMQNIEPGTTLTFERPEFPVLRTTDL